MNRASEDSVATSAGMPRAEVGSSAARVFTFKTPKSGGGNGPLATEILAELATMFQLSLFVETGTYLGDTVAAAVPVFGEIHTIELSPELAQKAAQRFAGVGKVRVHHGDSADRLLEILQQTSGAPLIWLDGHYSEGVTARGRGNTPVIEELKSIDRSGIANAVILIDDLRLFDRRAPLAGDPASLGGYPSVLELYRLVAAMEQKYQVFVYGDVALILPAATGVQVSPLVMAMTISRMFDGSNLPIEEVLAAEEVIAATRGSERDALRQLTQSRNVRTTEGYGLGLAYRLWEGLAALGENAAAAEQEFTAVIKLGFTHWRAKWYLARACAALGKTAEMRGLLAEVLAANPSFAPASLMQGNEKPATAAGGADLGKLTAAGLWRQGQPLRLHLGCGEQRFEGYINIDYPSDQHNVMQVRPDYQADITQLDLPPQSVDEIRLHHVFEHFNRVTALAMLIKWQQWLKVGGKLHIETPDLMGSAEMLVSKAPWSMKMGAVRHLAGDQAASWAYHVDHWFPERYEHTLQQLGFGRVETQSTHWPHPPHLCNVHAIGFKTEIRSQDELLAAADALLWESTLALVEKPTYDVWVRQLRAVLNHHTPCRPGNIHVADVGIEPVVPATLPVAVPARRAPPAQAGQSPAPTAPAAGVLPLDEIYDFNQRSRDRWVRAKAATVPAGSRVLDMGAGTCLYRPLFAHCVYQTHDFMQYEGAEKHGGTSAYGKIDYVSEILAIPVPDHSFDIILCTEVLEHVPEPIKVLQEISRILRPGGRAFITAPLGSGLHQLPFHFYGGYTPEWYRRFSKEAGLEATEITPNGGFFKHLAQECARAGDLFAKNRQLHGPEANELFRLLIENLPRLFFAMDDKCFDERFTVGYFVEAVKSPQKGGAKETRGNQTVVRAEETARPVVVKLMGGMGNQMFQYAAGLALARRTGAKLTLDLSFLLDRKPRPDFVFRNYDLDLFDLAADCEVSNDARAVARDLPLLKEKHFNYDPQFASLTGGHYLDGYWQSPRYFGTITDEIRGTFTAFRTRLTPAQQAMAERIRAGQAVCVNVRRGDFVSTPHGRACHGVCEADYFRYAAQVIRRRVPDAHFFVFSDDVKWCRQANLLDGAPCTFVGHDYAGDRFGAYLQLMMSCRHFIVPNSTFGWWAAFLGTASDKIVIAPEPWFSSAGLDTSDLLPKGWIRLCRNPGPVAADQTAAPIVSVIVPCYKQAHYLEEAIGSVVAQTFPDWELIVVNDGSPDDTSRVTREIIARHPERRIRLLEKTNGGLADARNAGIKEARGKYLLPLDSDDKVHPEMLQKTVGLLDLNPRIAIAYTDLVQFGGSSKVLRASEYDFSLLPLQNQLNCCSLFRREAWVEVGGYNPNMKLGYEDWDFWVGCGEKGFFGRRIAEPLFYYRVKDSSMYTKAREHHGELHAQLVLNHPNLFNQATRNEAARILAEVQTLPSLPAPSVPKEAQGHVSVVIPCYNQAQFLTEAVESVIGQKYQDWEIIIVNDGSPDNTSEIAQNLILNKPGCKIRLLEKQNGGLSDARNAGIRCAQGEYILPLDADDMIDPTFLAKTVALLDERPEIGIAYTDWVYFGAQKATRNALEYDFQQLCTKENLFTCTSLYRKKAWEAVGGYNPNMTKGLEDWDFWVGCGERGFIGKRIPEALFYYRAKPGSMIDTVQPHVQVMFARMMLNHPKLYHPDLVENARKLFVAAKLPPPKESSTGVEWFSPAKNQADFQRIVTGVEELVRAHKFDAAIIAIQQALTIAPTMECVTRAKEILAMLRHTPPAAAEALKTNIASTSNDFFGADEVQTIEQLITAYSNSPSDPHLLSQLHALQQGLMKFLVTAEQETLEGQFQGSLGHVFRALVKSGLSSEPPPAEIQLQWTVLDETPADPEDSANSFDLRPFLARMLWAPAHRGNNRKFALEEIPAWFLDDYLGYLLHAPQVFFTAGEAEQYHAHILGFSRMISQRIRTAPNDPLTQKVASLFAARVNYIPLYLCGGNTREVAEKRAAIIEFTLRKNGATLDATLSKRPKHRRKIKVGFINAHFGAQTETHVTLPTLQLDRQKFELCLFPVGRNPGPIEDYCRSLADSCTPLPQDLHHQVRTIRNAALDVVIIGTNVTAVTNQVSLIALHRLAPLQLVSYCSPVSTGMRNIDGYLTGTLNGRLGLQQHFSEKLLFCEGPPGCLDYTVESKGGSARIDRSSLGLAEDDIVYLNAAACFKILPEMQETWAKILTAVPRSRLLLMPFNPNWSKDFPVKQFTRTLGETFRRHGLGEDRFILVRSLPSRADVMELEKVADVYLDTFPFSGSIAVIDPLELGIPPVVWEGKTHRSQAAAALLRELDIPELIAPDEDTYIQTSARLGTEAALRQQFRSRVLAGMSKKPRFINPAAYGEQLGALLERLVLGANKAKSAPLRLPVNTPPAIALVA